MSFRVSDSVTSAAHPPTGPHPHRPDLRSPNSGYPSHGPDRGSLDSVGTGAPAAPGARPDPASRLLHRAMSYGTVDECREFHHDDRHALTTAEDRALMSGGCAWWLSWPMARALLAQFAPAVLANLLFFANQTLALLFTGQVLGARAIAEISIGLTTANITGVALGIGMANALDTLAPQAFGRCPRGPEVSEWLQTGLVLTALVCTPVAVLWVWAGPVVMPVLFGHDIGPGAAEFLVGSVPFLFLQSFADCVEKALIGQQRADIPLKAALIATPCCAIACHRFITPHGTVLGPALALSVGAGALLFGNVGLALYDRNRTFFRCREAWPFSRRSLAWPRVKRYCSVAGPAMAALLMEWAAFEVYMVLATTVGEAAVVRFAIFNNVGLVIFSVPFGMAAAIGALVGESLGALRSRIACGYAALGVTMTVVISAVFIAGFAAVARPVYACYNRAPEVVEAMAGMLWAQVLLAFTDAVQTALQGIFRGAGQQASAARYVTLCLWGVGVPVAWALLHRGWGMTGLLLGCCLGTTLLIPVQGLAMVLGWDWRDLAEEAAAEVEAGGIVSEEELI